MTKFVVQSPNGAKYYVMRERHRPSDPLPDQVSSSLDRSKKYTRDSLHALVVQGALHEMVVSGQRFAFVREDASQLLAGTQSGFLKIFCRRFGYKHVCVNTDQNDLISRVVEEFSHQVGPVRSIVKRQCRSKTSCPASPSGGEMQQTTVVVPVPVKAPAYGCSAMWLRGPSTCSVALSCTCSAFKAVNSCGTAPSSPTGPSIMA
eukprot:m51a1_g1309 hypothetical protein (204) ;mRNA; r:212121-212843